VTLLRKAISMLRAKAYTEPLPAAPASFGTGLLTGAGAASRSSTLGKMGDSAWLFAIIDRIASSVAAAEWQLWRGPESDARKVLDHPLLRLWDQPSTRIPRMQMLEQAGQHFELVGEQWWAILRDGRGVPVELQLLRPDRMHPAAGADGEPAWEYRIGNDRYPLEVSDVMPVIRPHPTEPRRGIGVVQSLLVELGADKAAAEFTAAFFQNSAEPGGIVTVPHEVDDEEFRRFADRWRLGHQGASNARRVAFLDNGYAWSAQNVSHKDMEYAALRRLTRDFVLGAFGMPPSAIGVVENVNLANAAAGMELFARWIVLPRLRRIRAALNMFVASQFPGDLRFDFVNPVPDNRELDLAEAVQGYEAGFMTRNEARARVELEAVPDGDDFISLPVAASTLRVQQRRVRVLRQPLDPAGLLPDSVRSAEIAARQAWASRLAVEAEAIGEYLAQFYGEHERRVRAPGPSDVGRYDWGWQARYGEAVEAELAALFEATLVAEAADLPLPELQRRAAEYARLRGGELLSLDGEPSIVRDTRTRGGELVAQAVESGDSLRGLQKRLREGFAFSPSRAESVARTESATALGQGRKQIAVLRGNEEKAWFTQGAADPRVDQVCLDNEAAGWIPVDDLFPSGHDTVPAHSRCQCVCQYRNAPVADLSGDERLAVGAGRVIRCPECNRRQGVNGLRGRAELLCVRCRHEWSVMA